MPVKKDLKSARKSSRNAPARHPGQKAVASPVKAPRIAVAYFKKKLLDIRESLIESTRKRPVRESVPEEVGDEADQASNSLEREILFELSGNERQMLEAVEAALARIEKGVYGVCEGCRKPIPKARLEAVPYARYCVPCQSSTEVSREESYAAVPDLDEPLASSVENE